MKLFTEITEIIFITLSEAIESVETVGMDPKIRQK